MERTPDVAYIRKSDTEDSREHSHVLPYQDNSLSLTAEDYYYGGGKGGTPIMSPYISMNSLALDQHSFDQDDTRGGQDISLAHFRVIYWPLRIFFPRRFIWNIPLGLVLWFPVVLLLYCLADHGGSVLVSPSGLPTVLLLCSYAFSHHCGVHFLRSQNIEKLLSASSIRSQNVAFINKVVMLSYVPLVLVLVSYLVLLGVIYEAGEPWDWLAWALLYGVGLVLGSWVNFTLCTTIFLIAFLINKKLVHLEFRLKDGRFIQDIRSAIREHQKVRISISNNADGLRWWLLSHLAFFMSIVIVDVLIWVKTVDTEAAKLVLLDCFTPNVKDITDVPFNLSMIWFELLFSLLVTLSFTIPIYALSTVTTASRRFLKSMNDYIGESGGVFDNREQLALFLQYVANSDTVFDLQLFGTVRLPISQPLIFAALVASLVGMAYRTRLSV